MQLGIRVREPLDDLLRDLVHRLRADGRPSKTELVEMALVELVTRPPAELRARLEELRRSARRPPGRR